MASDTDSDRTNDSRLYEIAYDFLAGAVNVVQMWKDRELTQDETDRSWN
jgi:hypothetical protein